MTYKAQLENGAILEFDKEPTAEDIDYAIEQYDQFKPNPQKESQSFLSKLPQEAFKQTASNILSSTVGGGKQINKQVGNFATEVLNREESIATESIRKVMKDPAIASKFILGLATGGGYGKLIEDLSKHPDLQQAFQGKRTSQLGDIFRDFGADENFSKIAGLTLSSALPTSFIGGELFNQLKAGKKFGKIAQKVGKNQKQLFQDLLTSTAEVSPEAISELQSGGVKQVFTKDRRSPLSFLRFGESIIDNSKKVQYKIGKELEEVKRTLKKSDAFQVFAKDIASDFNNDLLELGTAINKKGQFVTGSGAVVESSEKAVRDVFRLIFDETEGLLRRGKNRLSIEESFRLLDQIGNAISKAGKGTSEGVILSKLKRTLSERFRKSISDINLRNKYMKVNDRYSKLKDIFETLKDEGIVEVGKKGTSFKRGTGSAKLAGFFADNKVQKQPMRLALEDLDSFVKKETGEEFLPELKRRVAAMEFNPKKFQGIRTGVLGVAGGIFGGPVGTALMLPVGIGITTPRAAAFMMNMGQKTGRGISSTAPYVASTILRKLIQKPNQETS